LRRLRASLSHRGPDGDRFYHGHVIDFIDIHLPGYRWPAFNIADIAIFLGVAIYLILVISDSKKSKSS
jgi:lipoprotein signal peptidase